MRGDTKSEIIREQFIMRRKICAAFGLALGITLTPMAQAQDNAVVVELFTSQGCSACPPADAYIERLAGRDDVIALALHVDYWDYIGWADAFASPAFTERQKEYAKAINDRVIYTPQFVVQGTERVEGVHPMQMADLITAHRDAAHPVTVRLEREGDSVRIRISAEPPLSQAALVQLVRYIPQETMLIERGENAGRTVSYHNIVTLWDTISRWDGQAPLEMIAKAEGDQPVVVVIQAEGHGPILAAARSR